MGKATERSEYMAQRPLTQAEISERQAAAESGGAVEATTDGTLVTRAKPSEAPRVVLKAPQQTWD